MKDRLYKHSPIRAKRAVCTRILCACLGSSGRAPVRRYFAMTLVHSWLSSWLSSIVLQVGASMIEGLVCTYMGNNMVSLIGSEATIPAKASTCTLSAPGIFRWSTRPTAAGCLTLLLDIASCARHWLRIPPVRVSQRVENRCRFGA